MASPTAGYVVVDLLNVAAFQGFLAAVGDVAERAPEMTGYEVRSELFRAFEHMAENIEPPPCPA